MLSTVIYYGGVRQFAQQGVSVKSTDFQNDADGGIQSILFDIKSVNSLALGSNAIKINS